VLRGTLAASRGQGRGVALVDNPSLLYTKLGPELGARRGGYECRVSIEIAVLVGEQRGDHK